MNAPFPIIPELTAISIAYKNRRLIADDVLPRMQVSKQEFRYTVYSLADSFTIPKTQVGRTSEPTQIEFGGTQTPGMTQDYALDNPIPTIDIENAQPPFNPEGHGTELITNLIALDREVRVANLVFNPANYGTNNKHTNISTEQWSDTVNSNPIAAITSAMDAMVMRPNIMVMGRAVFSALSVHPRLIKAYYGNLADSGIVSQEFMATLFGLDAIYVGEGWVNTSKRGQTPTVTRVWGKSAALIYRDSLATSSMGTTYGFTAQFGTRIAGRVIDPDLGMRGGVRVRVGESVVELITAPDLGYLWSAAIA